MKTRLSSLFLLLLTFTSVQLTKAQFPGCPAVIVNNDTTISCGGCMDLIATPVSGYQTTAYTVGQIPYNPFPYNAGTNVLINIDDTWSGVENLSFPFCFFGNVYTQALIGSNGLITFDLADANGYCQWPIGDIIPSVNNPMNSIMSPFHDIDPSINQPGQTLSVNYATYGTAPCRVFVVSFYNIPMFGGSCNQVLALNATHQIAIYETTNVIDVYIESKQTCPSWNSGAAIEGIQNATGTVGYVVPGRNYPTQWNATNDAWRFTPSGPINYTVTWYDPANNVIANVNTINICPPASGTYTAEVVYTNCDGTTVTVNDAVNITVPANINLNINPFTDASCNGGNDGTATVNAAGGLPPYNYAWDNGEVTQTAVNLTAGTHTVTVTDQGGCGGTAQVTIGEPPAIVVNVNGTVVTCPGDDDGTATANAAGGAGGPFTYTWSDGQNGANATGLSETTYFVTATDANGCTGIGSVTIGGPPPLAMNTNTTPTTCSGGNDGTASVNAGGGNGGPFTYLWSNGQNGPNATNLTAGTHSVTVTDQAGCIGVATVVVGSLPPVIVNANSNNPLCTGSSDGAATANAAGGTPGYTYSWSNGGNTQAIVGIPAGTYTVTATDINGCIGTTTITLTDPPLLTATVTIFNGTCATSSDGTMNANPNGGTPPYSYSWTTGGNTQQIGSLGAGTFTVTVTDNNGCTTTATGTVVPPAPLGLTLTGPLEICQGESMTLNCMIFGGSAPFTYNWVCTPGGFSGTNSSFTVTPSASTFNSVSLTVTDANGCTVSNSYVVDVHPKPIATFNASAVTGCDSLPVKFFNHSVYGETYLWDFGDGNFSTAFEPTHLYQNGLYSVQLIVTSLYGCKDTLFLQNYIEVVATPIAEFHTVEDPTGFIEVKDAEFHFINTSSGAIGYEWNFDDGYFSGDWNPIHAFTYPDTFGVSLIAYNKFGCADTAWMFFDIVPRGNLWVPNAFTPNGDGINDFFDVYGINIVDYHMEVFSRWGELLFISDDMVKSWDGLYQGKVVTEGAYAWVANIVLLNGDKGRISGTVTVLR